MGCVSEAVQAHPCLCTLQLSFAWHEDSRQTAANRAQQLNESQYPSQHDSGNKQNRSPRTLLLASLGEGFKGPPRQGAIPYNHKQLLPETQSAHYNH